LSYDLLIENGKIIDGAGNPWFRADVGVVSGCIEAIGKLEGAKTDRRIDADGLVVAPGFIDIHSHSDYSVLINRRVESKVRQGVTTEVVGNCGSSAAPMNQEVREYRERYMRTDLGEDFKFNWETMEDYLNLVDAEGVSFNVVPLVGQGTIRQNVMGYNDRPPTGMELMSMRRLVAEAMEDGAWGMSTGLIYTPGCYADTDEIAELVKVVAEHDSLYFSHIRGEGETLLEAVEEAIEIGKRAGVPVQIAHFKASGKEYWGKTKESLNLVESGRRQGVDVTFDQYPYVASSTSLAALLPHWAHEGGAEKLLERLRDSRERRKIAAGPAAVTRDWASVMVVLTKSRPEYEGKLVADIAKLEGKEPLDSVFDLLLAEEAQVRVVIFGMSEDDVRRVMRSPNMMVGSDGRAVTPEGILGRGKPHPRYYGTFPRVLGHYVREGVLSLPEAVRKMTSMPAQRLGLWDRGLLREGFVADMAVFNQDLVRDEAIFTDPHRFASGILHVIVNGTIVIDDSEHMGTLPGRALRKSK
jgi:N-acyl-D-amino-acid deacylase